MINNRQAGRRRGRGGQQQQRSQGNPGRPDNGNRIDNRARGNAAQLLEKYKSLARDAQMAGDRVNTEYYLQFADHYFRVLAESRARFEENRRQNGQFDEDEGEYDEDGETVRADRYERTERPERQERQPYQGRDNRERDGRERSEGEDRQDRPRRFNGNGNGSERPCEERQPRISEDQPSNEERAPAQNFGVEGEVDPNVATPPRRRGRPRRESSETSGFDAAVLPPAIGAPANGGGELNGEAASGETAPAAPRRRGRPRLNPIETPAAE